MTTPLPVQPTTQERDAVRVLYRSSWFAHAAEPFAVAVQLIERLARAFDAPQIEKHYAEIKQKLENWHQSHVLTVSALRHGPTENTLSVLTTVSEDLVIEHEGASELYRRELRYGLGSLAYDKLVEELRIRLEDSEELRKRDGAVAAPEISTAQERTDSIPSSAEETDR